MNFSKINDQLYIGTTPKRADFTILHELKVDLVINMRLGRPPQHDPLDPPIRILWLPVLDSPLIPIPMSMLHKGVQEALEVIEAGGIVYTHCTRGRHRGPAMGACILIAQGMDPYQAMELIKQRRPVADPHIWYIERRIRKFAEEWKIIGE